MNKHFLRTGLSNLRRCQNSPLDREQTERRFLSFAFYQTHSNLLWFACGQVATGGVLILQGTITTIKTIHFVVFHSSSKE